MKEQDKFEYEKRFEQEPEFDSGIIIKGIAIFIGFFVLVLMNKFL